MDGHNLVLVASSSQVERFFEDVHVLALAVKAGRFRNLLEAAERVRQPWERSE